MKHKPSLSLQLLAATIAFTAQPLCAQVTRTFTEPYEQIELSAAETGIIQNIAVREGQTVKANALIGNLDNRVLEQSKLLAEQRANSTAKSDAANADLKIKRKLYENLAQLLRSGQANPNEVERAEADFRQADAAVRLASEEAIENRIEVDRIKAQISQREIRSPIDGVVLTLHRKRGEYVSNSKPEFATIVQLSKLKARFFVGTAYAETLKAGTTVSTLVGRRRVPVSAVVEFVSPVTDSQSGTVRIDVVMENSKQQLRAGVLCELVTETAMGRTPRFSNRTRPAVPPRSDTTQQALRIAPNGPRK